MEAEQNVTDEISNIILRRKNDHMFVNQITFGCLLLNCYWIGISSDNGKGIVVYK